MRKIGSRAKLLVGVAIVVIVTATVTCNSRAALSQVEPKAAKILLKMSKYLAGIKQFSVETENSLEVVQRTGEKIQFINPAHLTVQRPNKMYADRKGDLVNQEFYYDGKTLTLYLPDQKFFATADAPSTIDEALDFARSELDVFAPGGDLIYSNAYDILTEDVVSGAYIGQSVVGGVTCHHLAFRGNEVDWQIWIEDGDRPLPKKLVITSKWMAGAPQFVVFIKSWDLSPEISADEFSFTPPEGAQRINFVGPAGN